MIEASWDEVGKVIVLLYAGTIMLTFTLTIVYLAIKSITKEGYKSYLKGGENGRSFNRSSN